MNNRFLNYYNFKSIEHFGGIMGKGSKEEESDKNDKISKHLKKNDEPKKSTDSSTGSNNPTQPATTATDSSTRYNNPTHV